MKSAFVCLLLCVTTIGVVAQVSPDDSVLDKSVTLKLEQQEFSRFSNYLTRVLKVPLGFEESLLDSGHQDYGFEPNLPFAVVEKNSEGKTIVRTGAERVAQNAGHLISIDANGVKLSEALDIVVSQMPNYKWSIENGVVRITPVKGRNPIFEELLAIPIDKASIEKGVIICDIRLWVPTIPVVAKFLESRKVKAKTMSLAGYCDREIRESLTVENVTLERFLNEIVKKKGGAWAVRYKKDSNLESGYDPNIIDINL